MPMSGKRELSLYFHIPFCTHKCHYCNFFVLPNKEVYKKQLREGLLKDWARWEETIHSSQIKSLYFGGGTPSLFGPNYIGEIIERIKELPNQDSPLEITLEANPENITEELMQAYFDVGVNRLSIGIQSFQNHHLQMLTRTHDAEKAIDSIHIASKVGFKNISIDLMYDLPHQKLRNWESDLDIACQLPIHHISLYNLTIEPHTPFYKQKEKLSCPTDALSNEMYQLVQKKLSHFQQYEISAFAKEGKYSVHNTGYWTGREFIGLGPSAFSYYNGQRFKNVSHLKQYCENDDPIDYREDLIPEERKKELLAVNLRLTMGVNLDEFQKRYGPLQHETEKAIDRLCRDGLVRQNQQYLLLTPKGVLLYDSVGSELI